jgi:hypothetical protein
VNLLPKEHGAYGQITFPVLTAFVVAGVSIGGLLMTAAVVAGFLAHEPASVLLGLRGPRAKRELRAGAIRWLVGCGAAGAAAGAGAWLTISDATRWSLLVPIVPAILLATAMVRGREKSGFGEVTAALAFSGVGLPVSLAAGATLQTGLAVAIPFALLFVATTLAVRVVILRVRGGGNPRATAATRRAAYLLAGGAAIALGALTAMRVLPASVLVSAAPGLLTAIVVAANPPAPTRLRALGWTLVTVSVVTAAVVVVTAA